ncbi:hypothetical protein RhiirA1_471716 [Rhizophagus irregularis]|uniref:Uncharacterized protein n=3 Tax=Rhizophagus irregularis TaxID=588596 RepID=A0A2N0R3W6_9GLOM|nr:hypothetical protein RhiirA1_471716 [Rhizophagus irregularis]
MVKRRGDAKGRSTAAKSTKIVRTYSPDSRKDATSSKINITNSRNYNKGRRAKESEYEQDNLDRQDEDIEEEEEDDRQDDDLARLLEQNERNIEGEREKERGEIERREEEKREKERREKRNNNNRQNDLARLLEQEERNTEKRREKERRENNKDREENENDENEDEEEIPSQFGAKTNQLQICNWLVLHPNVLHLANEMLAALSTPPSSNTPLTTLTSSTLSASDNNDKYRLIDEEMKCLFLRTRNPPDHAFNKITQKIFGHDAYQSMAKSINERYLKEFQEFQQMAESECNTERSNPTDVEVNNFISREVVLKRILSRQVSAIDFTKLSETSLEKLVEFSRKGFKIVWSETDSSIVREKIKELDIITEGLEIPSRSGRNIASSLKLQFFS